MVDEAVAFAMKAHEGAFRKGTKVPYIVHPLETAVIVSMMSEDEELVCAAILHDVVEDAGVSEQQLETLFGQRVTAFVMEETEDKTKSWKERKAATLKHLEHAWYYNGVAERIRELSEYPACQEYFGLCRKVFGDS